MANTLRQVRSALTSTFRRQPQDELKAILTGPDSTHRDEIIEIMNAA